MSCCLVLLTGTTKAICCSPGAAGLTDVLIVGCMLQLFPPSPPLPFSPPQRQSFNFAQTVILSMTSHGTGRLVQIMCGPHDREPACGACAGMQDVDKQTSRALLDFSYHLAIGDMNEAYKVRTMQFGLLPKLELLGSAGAPIVPTCNATVYFGNATMDCSTMHCTCTL